MSAAIFCSPKEPFDWGDTVDNRLAEYQTRLQNKQLLQAKSHEFYALNTEHGEAQ